MLQPWLEERGLEQNTQVFNDLHPRAFTLLPQLPWQLPVVIILADGFTAARHPFS